MVLEDIQRLLNAWLPVVVQLGTAFGVLLSVLQNVKIRAAAQEAKAAGTVALESSVQNGAKLEQLQTSVGGAVGQLAAAAETAVQAKQDLAELAGTVKQAAEVVQQLPLAAAVTGAAVVVPTSAITEIAPGVSLVTPGHPQQ